MTSPQHSLPWISGLLAILLTGACASTPSPTPDTQSPTQDQNTSALDSDEDLDTELLESCEELFATLNALDTSQVPPSSLMMAEESADQRSELCREVFRKAAKTPGALALADIFADLMKVRAFEIRMDMRAIAQETKNVCPDSRLNLDRLNAITERAQKTLGNKDLTPNERGALTNVVQSTQSKSTSLEPFFRRTCKTGIFDPTLLITVDDLKASKSMTPPQCMDILVAFAAFDLEQAPPEQTLKLVAFLKEAQTPCLHHLKPKTDDTSQYNAEDLERANQRDLFRNSFVLVEMAIAMGNQDTVKMCGHMRSYIKNIALREKRLKALSEDTRLAKDLRTQSAQEYLLARDSLRDTEENYKAMCSL